jgi:hypothetical protein
MSAVGDVINRIRAGEKLHMQFVDGRSVWWFEQPHEVIANKVIALVLSDPASPLREAGDSLFGLPLNSQTFMSEFGHE